MSSSASGSPGGQPSITQPIAAPWLSPQVVTRNALPMVFPGIARFYGTVPPDTAESDDSRTGSCDSGPMNDHFDLTKLTHLSKFRFLSN